MSKATRTVIVNDKMENNYRYALDEPAGKHLSPDFKPELTPKQMIELGVFGGKYIMDCRNEFPKDWFKNARLSPE